MEEQLLRIAELAYNYGVYCGVEKNPLQFKNWWTQQLKESSNLKNEVEKLKLISTK